MCDSIQQHQVKLGQPKGALQKKERPVWSRSQTRTGNTNDQAARAVKERRTKPIATTRPPTSAPPPGLRTAATSKELRRSCPIISVASIVPLHKRRIGRRQRERMNAEGAACPDLRGGPKATPVPSATVVLHAASNVSFRTEKCSHCHTKSDEIKWLAVRALGAVVSASRLHRVGRGFESLSAHHPQCR